MCNTFFLQSLVAGTLALSLATFAAANAPRIERLTLAVDSSGAVKSETIRADQKLRYEMTVQEGLTLSVDLLSKQSNVQFTIKPANSDFAIHASSLDGRVADIVIPEAGEYVVDVFLQPDDGQSDSAVREARGRALVTIGLYSADRSQALLDGPDFWAVTGLKEGALLNLRTGPSTRYQADGQLGNGEPLQNNGCRLTRGERWCFVRVPGLDTTGWVAGRFLAEGRAP